MRVICDEEYIMRFSICLWAMVVSHCSGCSAHTKKMRAGRPAIFVLCAEQPEPQSVYFWQRVCMWSRRVCLSFRNKFSNIMKLGFLVRWKAYHWSDTATSKNGRCGEWVLCFLSFKECGPRMLDMSPGHLVHLAVPSFPPTIYRDFASNVCSESRDFKTHPARMIGACGPWVGTM